MIRDINFNAPPPGWSSGTNGTLTRPLDLIENWFLDRINRPGVSPQREPDGITEVLKLKFPNDISDPIPYLQRAWLVLRYLHPLLGAAYPPFSGQDQVEQQRIILAPPDPDKWLKMSFRVNEGDDAIFKDTDDAVKLFQASATAMAHWLPSSSQLLIRTSHLRLDGVGILKVTNTFMIVLASVIRLGLDVDIWSYASDIKHPALSPGVDHVLGLKSEEEPIQPYAEQVIDGLVQEWNEGMKSIALPIREGSENAILANTRFLRISLDKSASKLIRQACTGRGISVSAAVHASIIRVVASFQQHPMAKNILIPLIANLRHLLHPRYDTPEYAGSPCCYIVPFCITDVVGKNGTFDELAKQVTAIYSTDLAKLAMDEDGKPISFLDILKPYSDREAVLLSAELPADAPPMRPPNLSSFGVLERLVKGEYKVDEGQEDVCEIEDMWIAVEMADATPEFQLCTFRNTMRISLCFNDVYYDEDLMIDILHKVRDELIKGTVTHLE